MGKVPQKEPAHVPAATYRLQLNGTFTLRDALELVPYFHQLGISDLYLSPILTARPGSLHGYDITDHSAINPEIGTMEDLGELARALEARGMGILLDIVPNHMCVSHSSNKWWWDVLENGPSSAYAAYFDIDWNPPKPELANKVLLPVLGDQYGAVLESEQLRLAFRNGSFAVSYSGTHYPIAPRTWPTILEPALEALSRSHAPPDAVTELESILTALSYLPARTETDPSRLRERQREKEVIKRRLAVLCEAFPSANAAIEQSLRSINGVSGDPASFDRLDALLRDQAYRLCSWKVAADEINYRRFFDINDLGAIRVEDHRVFEDVHAVALELVQRGIVKGFRVDHPDGLFDPAGYFRQIQEACRRVVQAQDESRSFFVVAEKILVGSEDLRNWEIQGTTGYGFLNQLNGLFVAPQARDQFERRYRSLAGITAAAEETLRECKQLILRVSMSSEIAMLARRLDCISEQHRGFRDFTMETLKNALSEIIIAFPVYRTYVVPGEPVDPEDQRHIESAVLTAKRRNPAMSESVIDFVRSLLLHDHPPSLSPDQVAERQLFAMRVQQISGQVMARSLEDTAHYRYLPLASLNEVGAELGVWSATHQQFHRKARIRERAWPNALLATSTHDTKRGEDTRARINVLSEIPAAWFEAVRRWQSMNAPHRKVISGSEAPSANEEYLLYQTLIGTWPAGNDTGALPRNYVERVQRYVEKALREAKVHSSWINPNPRYEAQVLGFVAAILDPLTSGAFLGDFISFARRIELVGSLNSLSQLVLKMTSPGVPDFYQGTELWDLTLVDPDNRNPVDFEHRRCLLESLTREAERPWSEFGAELLADSTDGRIKMFTMLRALRFRRDHTDLFRHGRYAPLGARGAAERHCIAFARVRGQQAMIVAVGRFFAGLPLANGLPLGDAAWSDTVLSLGRSVPPGPYRDVVTGQVVSVLREDRSAALPLRQAFALLPFAILAGENT